MDTTEQYIKMLLALPQEFWDDWQGTGEGDFMTEWAYVCSCGETGAKAAVHHNFPPASTGEHKVVPYVRQDQLQEMVEWKRLVHFWKVLSSCEWEDWSVDRGAARVNHSSYSQLLLAFTEKEKYNKVWNGTEWVI